MITSLRACAHPHWIVLNSRYYIILFANTLLSIYTLNYTFLKQPQYHDQILKINGNLFHVESKGSNFSDYLTNIF